MKLLALKHIPSHLHANFNETVDLSQLQIQVQVSELFKHCHQNCVLMSQDLYNKIDHSEEYNLYRRELGIVFNPPIAVNGYLNQLATGWKGDAYALAQRQQESILARSV